MSSSRVFLDEEVDPTNEYLAWLVFYFFRNIYSLDYYVFNTFDDRLILNSLQG